MYAGLDHVHAVPEQAHTTRDQVFETSDQVHAVSARLHAAAEEVHGRADNAHASWGCVNAARLRMHISSDLLSVESDRLRIEANQLSGRSEGVSSERNERTSWCISHARALLRFSQDPIRHRALVLHYHGLKWLEPLTAERFCFPQKHFFIHQKTLAAVRQVIAPAFD